MLCSDFLFWEINPSACLDWAFNHISTAPTAAVVPTAVFVIAFRLQPKSKPRVMTVSEQATNYLGHIDSSPSWSTQDEMNKHTDTFDGELHSQQIFFTKQLCLLEHTRLDAHFGAHPYAYNYKSIISSMIRTKSDHTLSTGVVLRVPMKKSPNQILDYSQLHTHSGSKNES